MIKFKHFLPAATGLLIAAGLVAYLAIRSLTQVPSQHPRFGPVIESVYGLGTVVASQSYQVKTAVNQSVRELFVSEGDHVAAGAPLIQFDESGVIRAPFAGTVTSVNSRRKELIFPSSPALVLTKLDDLFLEVSLEQQAVWRVRRGQGALVSFETLRGERFAAKVQSIFPREAQFIVRISIERLPAGILPGMTADVAIEVGRKEHAIAVPLQAVFGGRLTLERGGKRIKVPVQLGVIDGEWAEVISDTVRADDLIRMRKP